MLALVIAGQAVNYQLKRLEVARATLAFQICTPEFPCESIICL